jgi:hypothetical protein
VWGARSGGKKGSGTIFDRVLDKITRDHENCLVGLGVNVRWYCCSRFEPSHHSHPARQLVFMDYSHENAGEIEPGPRQLPGVYSGRIHFKPYMNCHGRQLRLLKYYQNGTAEAGGPFSPSIALANRFEVKVR